MTTPSTAPSAERLDAAVRLVVDRLAPDQIILFGSGARNEMTPESDLDLLVIKDDDGGSANHERWQCPESGDQIDVVIMSRATAERHRLSASYVQGAALDEGRTVYLRDGATATATGPTCTWNGTTMVRTTEFEPDHAVDLLERAERKWATANRETHPVDKCEYLQRSIEYALKALITADGRRVRHLHNLDGMWREAEATGDSIPATRDPKQLEKLSRYAGQWRYDKLPADEAPETTWQQNRTTGEDVLNHARRRVPQQGYRGRCSVGSRSMPSRHERGPRRRRVPLERRSSRRGVVKRRSLDAGCGWPRIATSATVTPASRGGLQRATSLASSEYTRNARPASSARTVPGSRSMHAHRHRCRRDTLPEEAVAGNAVRCQHQRIGHARQES